MSTTLYNPDDGDDDLFGDRGRLLDVVPVELTGDHLRTDADARQFQLETGDEVVVDSDHGPLVAEVVGPVQRKVVDDADLPRVLRKANDADRQQLRDNQQLERRAYKFALERIRDRDLQMKLIRVQAMQDRSRLVFYFSADGRIDFRALVRDLAAEFKTRIEMRQIGVRDGAQMVGGIGPCGRELCCSTFLQDFEPISIRMAKQQGLTLNPNKISGMCGRLMCCLVYEQKLYRQLQSRLPEAGDRVETRSGTGEIRDVDVVGRRATITLDDGDTQTLPLDEVRLADAADPTVDTDVDPDSDDKLWDGDPPRRRGDDTDEHTGN